MEQPNRCTYTERDGDHERRCVKDQHDASRKHLLATIWTLDDVQGLPTAEEADE